MSFNWARETTCRVIEKTWLSPTVVGIRFEPSRKFRYEPGQFLSVIVPANPNRPGSRETKRAYSFASPSREYGYELCIKVVEGGIASNYMASLEPGDVFRAQAPYGHFPYHPKEGRSVCMISTGTGIAPMRSLILSDQFQDRPPRRALSLFGARTEDEILYPGLFQAYGVECVYAISRPSPEWAGFRGRVTDYLKSLPRGWAWHSTDFYLCGNGEMVTEVYELLRDSFGVKDRAIHQEIYFTGHKKQVIPVVEENREVDQVRALRRELSGWAVRTPNQSIR